MELRSPQPDFQSLMPKALLQKSSETRFCMWSPSVFVPPLLLLSLLLPILFPIASFRLPLATCRPPLPLPMSARGPMHMSFLPMPLIMERCTCVPMSMSAGWPVDVPALLSRLASLSMTVFARRSVHVHRWLLTRLAVGVGVGTRRSVDVSGCPSSIPMGIYV